MKKIFFLLIIFINVVFITACKKVINVDINNVLPQIVIEAVVNNATPATVTISKTVNFSASNIFPSVTGATVIIKDNAGNSFSLLPVAAGVYQNNNLIGVPGRTYTLNITAEGINYTAVSTMPTQVNLDTLLQDKIVFGTKYIKIVQPQYTDPVAIQNYYLFTETINNRVNKMIFVWDDRLSNGGISTRPLIESDSTINAGDIIKVEMECIDKSTYTYFRGLQDLQSNAATPVNPTSNIVGGVLGYFSANTSQIKQIKMN